jgi:hypothetical protein
LVISFSESSSLKRMAAILIQDSTIQPCHLNKWIVY